MIIPFLFFDLCLEIYHRVCFCLYELPRVRRSNYIKTDRYKLKYLTGFQKINCAYCGYANGLAHFASIIIARTEKYWCGIKHEKDPNFISPKHHKEFLEYNDEKAFKEKYK